MAARLNPGTWDVYISHAQAEAQAEAVAISRALVAHRCWLDVLMDDVSLPAMDEGMACSRAFLALLTPSYFRTGSQVREFDHAVNHRQPVLLVCPSHHDAEVILDTAPLPVQVWRAALTPRTVFVLEFSEPEAFAAGIRRISEELGCPTGPELGCPIPPAVRPAPMDRWTAPATAPAPAQAGSPAPAQSGGEPGGEADACCLGATDLSITVASGSGNQYLLLLRLQGDSATLTKQNPDGSVTTFKGRAPNQQGAMRLEGIQASNRGAFIMGQLPSGRTPGQKFTLQANAFANGDQTWECTLTDSARVY